MEKDIYKSINPHERGYKVGSGGMRGMRGTIEDLRGLIEKYGAKTPLAEVIDREVRGSGHPGLN